LAVDPAHDQDITLSMTMVGGQVVYCARDETRPNRAHSD
jgi:hypothetical protein